MYMVQCTQSTYLFKPTDLSFYQTQTLYQMDILGAWIRHRPWMAAGWSCLKPAHLTTGNDHFYPTMYTFYSNKPSRGLSSLINLTWDLGKMQRLFSILMHLLYPHLMEASWRSTSTGKTVCTSENKSIYIALLKFTCVNFWNNLIGSFTFNKINSMLF